MVAGTLAVLALLLLLGSRLHSVRHDLAVARADLREARRALVARHDAEAGRALERAQRRLRDARQRSDAPLLSLLRLLRPIPVLGGITAAVDASLTAGDEAVAAGRTVLAAASSLPVSGATAIDGSDLSLFHGGATRAGDAIVRAGRHLEAAGAVLSGPSGAVLPQVSGPTRALRAEVEQAHRQLEGARRGLALLADLTAPSTRTRLLVLAQDSLELRPTGGYVGSYGVLTFSAGTVALETYRATEDLPPPDPALPAPADLSFALPEGWRLSNVNWSPDFPTTAAAAREMFRRQGGGETDGVLALTDLAVARLTGALGPLSVPGYAQPVTEEGFSERVVHEVELKRPLDTPRKRFLVELAKVMTARLLQLPASEVPEVARAVERSVASGDIQLWFADEARQRQIAGTAVEGKLPAPDQDVLLVVDSNLSASKANLGLTKHMHYRVERDSGHLLARLEVVLENAAAQSPVNPYYHGYLRVYVPRRSRLVSVRAGQRAEPAVEGPYEVFSQRVLVPPKSREVVTFDYVLPPEVGHRGEYRLTWARQPGTPRDVVEAVVHGAAASGDPSQRTFRLTRRIGR